ncbi:MAG: hypothetical protein BWK78_06165 [Thiotrichaceae bacterium IS1]|nr:MAG: hypothetical protein BWK78_06165 [Thiotrichaceae bacterium IS1]
MKTHIWVITESQLDGSVPEKGDVVCVIGKDLKIGYENLQQKCGEELSSIEIDFLSVAGAVAFADRKIRRKTHQWARQLTIHISVYCPEQWGRSQNKLVECLNFLTGDYWKFEFIKREDNLQQGFQQTLLKDIKGQTVVIPYSGGMDSYADLNLVKHDEPDVKPFLVTIEFKKTLETRKSAFHTSHSLDGSDNRAYVPITFSELDHPEISFRSRTFVFFSVAAIVAKLIGSKRILIPESGQGALGTALITLGDEPTFQATVPTFTEKLRNFLTTLWNDALAFEHPYLWNTKAEVLHRLIEINKADDLLETCSCSRQIARNKGLSGAPQHCGVCSNCLLRRVALVMSGFTDYHEKEEYVWKNLDAEDLELATSFSDLETTRNDYEIAIRAVLNHQQLADLSTQSENFKDLVFQLSRSLGESEDLVTTRLENLLNRHCQEWENFLSLLAPNSWIIKIARR